MITKSPYGFGYGHKGRIAGTEPEWAPREYVRKADPQPVIDRCLDCTKYYCSGECEFTANGQIKSRDRKRTAIQEERRRLAEEQDRKDTAQAKEVARMCLDGWCESAIGRELGISENEVYRSIKLARKKGFLS